jgi:hypothetical protein
MSDFRPSGLRPLADSVARLTKQTFSRKFVSLGRILSQWDDIVGPAMAVKAQPQKIHYRKPKNASESPQATLDIAVSSADATTLHYQKDLILERLNQLFGEKWITGIKFVHLSPENSRDSGISQPYTAPPRALTSDENEEIEKTLSGIDDPDLRKRLESLGQCVLRKGTRKS